MTTDRPDLEDYARLFHIYAKDLGSLYREPDDDRYVLLFEQVTRGRFPEYAGLERVTATLSRLDLAYKRHWDARTRTTSRGT